MNPVDHVRLPLSTTPKHLILILHTSPTVVVIINILVKLRLSHGMPHKVKKQVLLRLGGRVYCGELRRRTKILKGLESDILRVLYLSFSKIGLLPLNLVASTQSPETQCQLKSRENSR